jgi:nitrate reductase gamma subunit
VDRWIEFGRGPLFRLTFSLLVLGLLRLVVFSLVGIVEAYRRSSDRIVPWRDVTRQTLGWLVPWGRLLRGRPVYSTISFVWHVGLLGVPLFLSAHVQLARQSLGIGWPVLSQGLADGLGLLTIAGALALFAGRVLQPGARALSRPQDHAWPLVLALPFVTGYLCANVALGPGAYRISMLVHVYSADLIMALIPFTKAAHCVLAPLSQVVTAVSWKLVPGAGARVAATLGHAHRPSWLEGSRAAAPPAVADGAKEACAK